MVAELLDMRLKGPAMKCLDRNGAEQPAWIGSLARANHMDFPLGARRAGRSCRARRFEKHCKSPRAPSLAPRADDVLGHEHLEVGSRNTLTREGFQGASQTLRALYKPERVPDFRPSHPVRPFPAAPRQTSTPKIALRQIGASKGERSAV
jgi:hypothetical protein